MGQIDTTPPLTLDAATLEAIRDAIVSAYDLERLDDRLHFRWGFELADEIAIRDNGFKYIVTRLLRLTEEQGRTLDLLAMLWSSNPGNPRLRAIAGRLLPDAAAALVAGDPAAALPALPGSLEALVSTRSRLVDFGAFTARLAAIGARVCRIDLPRSNGTGLLIGTAQVLTNYHVVKSVIDREVAPADVTVMFDFRRQPGATVEPRGIAVALATEWLGKWRPYSASDLSASGDPAPEELDYAVLNLAEPIGGDAADGAGRGWFVLSPRAPIVAIADVAMVPQHAQARPLEIAYGSVVALPGQGLRYRYDVTTEPGSSGSPMFTAELDPIGLHHAAEPGANPTYNQAVPLWRIARDIMPPAPVPA